MNYTLQWSPLSTFLINWNKELEFTEGLTAQHFLQSSNHLGLVFGLVFSPCTCSSVSGRFWKGKRQSWTSFSPRLGWKCSATRCHVEVGLFSSVTVSFHFPCHVWRWGPSSANIDIGFLLSMAWIFLNLCCEWSQLSTFPWHLWEVVSTNGW